MPPWVQEGGYSEWAKRLKDPANRERVKREMVTPTDKWESLYLAAGSPDKVLLVGFKNPKLKPLTGKTLAEVAKLRGRDPVETIMDLVLEDRSRIGTIYFLMSEENIKKQIRLPWVSFGSGERHFSSSLSLPGLSVSSQSSERSGRIVFGIAAVIIGLFFVFAVVSGAKRLWRDGQRTPR